MAAHTNQELVTRYFQDVLDRGDLEPIRKIFASTFEKVEVETERPIEAQTWTHQRLTKSVKAFREAFRDVEHTIKKVVAEESQVTVAWTARATHHQGKPITRKTEVILAGIGFFQFGDGKIVSWYDLIDRQGLREQLGT